MANTVPNPPYNTPFVDKTGLVTQAWRGWIRETFLRIGGSVALTNEELADLPALELAALEVRVDSAESDISALQILTTSQGNTIATHTIQISDLSQGPVL